jgi:hypothetical protein
MSGEQYIGREQLSDGTVSGPNLVATDPAYYSGHLTNLILQI